MGAVAAMTTDLTDERLMDLAAETLDSAARIIDEEFGSMEDMGSTAHTANRLASTIAAKPGGKS
jgi:hypothetical protein